MRYLVPYKPYIPQTVGELMDLIGGMTLGAPRFIDKSGYFPDRTIDTEFHALNEGLKAVRKRIGEEAYAAALELSGKARGYFEADPEDADPDNKGRRCFFAMEDVLTAATRRKA